MPANLGNSAVATGLEKVSFHSNLIEIYMQIKEQQSELDMEQQTCSKLGKEYIKAVYCHPAYLPYMKGTS